MREQASLLARVILASVCQTAAVKSVFPYLHFVLYAQHEFLQSLCLPPAVSRMNSLSPPPMASCLPRLPPALSRMHGLLPPSTPLAHLDAQPRPSRCVTETDDACKRRGLCPCPVQTSLSLSLSLSLSGQTGKLGLEDELLTSLKITSQFNRKLREFY